MAVKELYVGNLIYDVGLDDITGLFAPYGAVLDARVVAERNPSRPHAYAFVTMEAPAANEAMRALDGEDFMGRTLRVETAQENSGEDVHELQPPPHQIES